MTARLVTAIASTLLATAVAVAAAASAGAETASKRPTGVVLGCSMQSGNGAGSSQFKNRWNLVVGPLAMMGAAANPGYYSDSFGGNKFPLLVWGGHRVTVELSRQTRRGASLFYGRFPKGLRDYRDGYRVVTFIACRRGEVPGSPSDLGSIADGWPVSFWSGGVLVRSPRCVPLLIWVDDEPSPRRAVIHLGVRRCG